MPASGTNRFAQPDHVGLGVRARNIPPFGLDNRVMDIETNGTREPDHGITGADEPLDLLTVAEVASMLRLSKMTIYRLMNSGRLPALRVGRSFRIPRDSVRNLLEESDNRP